MAAVSILPGTWEIPAVFRERLGRQAGRQRLMARDGHLLLILHTPPEKGRGGRQKSFFWRRPDGAWFSTRFGEGNKSLDKHLDRFAQRLDAVEKQVDQAGSADELFDVLREIEPLLRTSRNLYGVLQEARQQVSDDRDLLNARDRAYELHRRAELLAGDAKNAMDYHLARNAETQARNSYQMARSSYRLNLLVAFFFPLATLAALFGMNLRNGLEGMEETASFWGVVIVGLIAGVFLKAFVSGDSKTPARAERQKPSKPEKY